MDYALRLSDGVPSSVVATLSDSTATVFDDDGHLLEALTQDRFSTLLVDPPAARSALPRILDLSPPSSPRVVLVADTSIHSASSILTALHPRMAALVLLPFDTAHDMRSSLVPTACSGSLGIAFLSLLAPRLCRLRDRIALGVLLAVHGRPHIDSVKMLAAYCGVSTRTIGRELERLDMRADRLLACARLTRARTAHDTGRSGAARAEQGGYSHANSLGRARRRLLGISARTFYGVSYPQLAMLLVSLTESQAAAPLDKTAGTSASGEHDPQRARRFA